MSVQAKRNSSIFSNTSGSPDFFREISLVSKPTAATRRYSTASRRVSVFSLEHLHCEVTDKVVNKFKQVRLFVNCHCRVSDESFLLLVCNMLDGNVRSVQLRVQLDHVIRDWATVVHQWGESHPGPSVMDM